MIDEFDKLDQEDDYGDIESSPMDADLIIKNLSNYNSEKLCEMIICDRYLGFNKEIALACMAELSFRRQNGNDFNFEDFIELAIKSLPIIDFSIPDLRIAMSKITSFK
jgi:hypothetical protein